MSNIKYPDDFINKIICGDCLEVMQQMPDKCVDLCLTDPPYGLDMDKTMASVSGVKTKNAAAKKGIYKSYGWDKKIPDKIIFDEIIRISKKQVIFGAEHLAHILPQSRGWLVWDKKTDDKYSNTFADAELMWTSLDKPTKVIRFLWHGMVQENMKDKEKRYHPTQKPVSLIKRLIDKDDKIIFDPFLGSGTTAVACKELNRKYIGIEINPEYCKIAENRLFNTQGSLF